MKVDISARDGFVVIGMKYRGRNENKEIPALWGEFMPRFGEITGVVDAPVFYGVMGNYDMATGAFDYVAGSEVLPDALAPEGMTRWEVPGGTYAVVSFPFSAIMEATHDAHRTWLPASGRQHTGGPEFEYYPRTFEPDDPNSEMQLWIPLV